MTGNQVKVWNQTPHAFRRARSGSSPIVKKGKSRSAASRHALRETWLWLFAVFVAVGLRASIGINWITVVALLLTVTWGLKVLAGRLRRMLGRTRLLPPGSRSLFFGSRPRGGAGFWQR